MSWLPGRLALGAWCSLPSPQLAQILAGEKLEYLCIDCQHGLIGYEAMLAMLNSTAGFGPTTFVRVASNDAASIGRALDAGADGVIVPMVESKDGAERAVAACHYPPYGNRSFGPTSRRILGSRGLLGRSNDPICVVMVETVAALGHLDEIVRVERLDGIYVGPSDLALSLGLSLNDGPGAPLSDAVETVERACRSAAVAFGIHAVGSGFATNLPQGIHFATVVSDIAAIRAGIEIQLPHSRPVEPYGGAQPGRERSEGECGDT